jgi:hypothetical protein
VRLVLTIKPHEDVDRADDRALAGLRKLLETSAVQQRSAGLPRLGFGLDVGHGRPVSLPASEVQTSLWIALHPNAILK